MAAGTVVVTEELVGVVKKVAFAWTSGTGAQAGTASGATRNSYNGEVIRLVTVPGAGGDQPDNLYDVAVNDEDSTDVLMGAGADRSNAAVEQVLASSLGCVANDKLSLSITNAGEAKKGVVYLYIR